jgi:hypothetical protein
LKTASFSLPGTCDSKTGCIDMIIDSVVNCGTLRCVLSRETGLPMVALVLPAAQEPK